MSLKISSSVTGISDTFTDGYTRNASDAGELIIIGSTLFCFSNGDRFQYYENATEGWQWQYYSSHTDYDDEEGQTVTGVVPTADGALVFFNFGHCMEVRGVDQYINRPDLKAPDFLYDTRGGFSQGSSYLAGVQILVDGTGATYEPKLYRLEGLEFVEVDMSGTLSGSGVLCRPDLVSLPSGELVIAFYDYTNEDKQYTLKLQSLANGNLVTINQAAIFSTLRVVRAKGINGYAVFGGTDGAMSWHPTDMTQAQFTLTADGSTVWAMGDYLKADDPTTPHVGLYYATGLWCTKDGYTWTVKSNNQAPIIDAQAPATANWQDTVTLNASGTTDPESDALTYQWVSNDGITLTNANSAVASFEAPRYDVDTDLTFTVTVNDGENSPQETVTVKVLAHANQVPTGGITANPSGVIPAATAVTLTANVTDPEGDSLTYVWEVTSGAADIADFAGSGSTATFTAPTNESDTDYSFRVTVDDGRDTAVFNLTVTVAKPVVGYNDNAEVLNVTGYTAVQPNENQVVRLGVHTFTRRNLNDVTNMGVYSFLRLTPFVVNPDAELQITIPAQGLSAPVADFPIRIGSEDIHTQGYALGMDYTNLNVYDADGNSLPTKFVANPDNDTSYALYAKVTIPANEELVLRIKSATADGQGLTGTIYNSVVDLQAGSLNNLVNDTLVDWTEAGAAHARTAGDTTFTGDNQAGEVTVASPFDKDGVGFYMSAKHQLTSTGGNKAILSINSSDSSSSRATLLVRNDGDQAAWGNSGGWIDSNVDGSDGSIYTHSVRQTDVTSRDLFVNGTISVSDTGYTGSATFTDVWIGAQYSNGSEDFTGEIYQTRTANALPSDDFVLVEWRNMQGQLSWTIETYIPPQPFYDFGAAPTHAKNGSLGVTLMNGDEIRFTMKGLVTGALQIPVMMTDNIYIGSRGRLDIDSGNSNWEVYVDGVKFGNNGNISSYLDGQPREVVYKYIGADNGETFEGVGANNSGNYNFKGALNNLRIHRGGSDINFWAMGEGSGGVFTDSIGGFDLTVVGTIYEWAWSNFASNLVPNNGTYYDLGAIAGNRIRTPTDGNDDAFIVDYGMTVEFEFLDSKDLRDTIASSGNEPNLIWIGNEYLQITGSGFYANSAFLDLTWNGGAHQMPTGAPEWVKVAFKFDESRTFTSVGSNWSDNNDYYRYGGAIKNLMIRSPLGTPVHFFAMDDGNAAGVGNGVISNQVQTSKTLNIQNGNVGGWTDTPDPTFVVSQNRPVVDANARNERIDMKNAPVNGGDLLEFKLASNEAFFDSIVGVFRAKIQGSNEDIMMYDDRTMEYDDRYYEVYWDGVLMDANRGNTINNSGGFHVIQIRFLDSGTITRVTGTTNSRGMSCRPYDIKIWSVSGNIKYYFPLNEGSGAADALSLGKFEWTAQFTNTGTGWVNIDVDANGDKV